MNERMMKRVRRTKRTNARLIAVAPDLLAALKALWEWTWEDNRGDGQYPEVMVRAAIEKAEGRS